MNGLWRRAAATALCALLMLAAAGALAQETMRVYVAEGAMDAQTARRLSGMLSAAFPQTHWDVQTQAETGESLRELVLADRAPALAVCAPGEALHWAQEGLLLDLHTHIGGQTRMQREVLDCCVFEERLFMAPLIARHRQMAVNERRFEEKQLTYMLDEMTWPVWYPTGFYQILEEFMLAEEAAMDVWRAQPETSAALEALVQAIYGGALLDEDGTRCQAMSAEIRAGVQWLGDAVESGLIGLCVSREEALARFVSGETAIFLDWTAQEAAGQADALEQNGVRVKTVAYPCAVGLPVRAYAVTGVCAFDTGDAAANARGVQAAAFIHENAQNLLGSRSIWQDHAIWLPSLDVGERGATLRSLFCEALNRVMLEGVDAETALSTVQAAMDALN